MPHDEPDRRQHMGQESSPDKFNPCPHSPHTSPNGAEPGAPDAATSIGAVERSNGEKYVVDWEMDFAQATTKEVFEPFAEKKIQSWACDPCCPEDAPVKKMLNTPKTREAREQLWSKMYPEVD